MTVIEIVLGGLAVATVVLLVLADPVLLSRINGERRRGGQRPPPVHPPRGAPPDGVPFPGARPGAAPPAPERDAPHRRGVSADVRGGYPRTHD